MATKIAMTATTARRCRGRARTLLVEILSKAIIAVSDPQREGMSQAPNQSTDNVTLVLLGDNTLMADNPQM
jgi:hypothetical protein